MISTTESFLSAVLQFAEKKIFTPSTVAVEGGGAVGP